MVAARKVLTATTNGQLATWILNFVALGPTQRHIRWVPRVLSPVWGGWVVKQTTHLYLVPRLGTRGAIPPLPNTSS
jgi:hypothetical protein